MGPSKLEVTGLNAFRVGSKAVCITIQSAPALHDKSQTEIDHPLDVAGSRATAAGLAIDSS